MLPVWRCLPLAFLKGLYDHMMLIMFFYVICVEINKKRKKEAKTVVFSKNYLNKVVA